MHWPRERDPVFELQTKNGSVVIFNGPTRALAPSNSGFRLRVSRETTGCADGTRWPPRVRGAEDETA